MRYLALLWISTALLMLATAHAQDWEQYYPLDIGNVWEYEFGYGAEYEVMQLAGYQRRTVLRDTTLDGAAHRIVRVDSIGVDYTLLGMTECAVRVLDGYVEWLPLSDQGGCWAPEDQRVDLRDGERSSVDGYIHGARHSLDLLKRPGEEYFQFGRDLGFLEWRYGTWWFVGADERYLGRLLYASVGGVTYGAPIDAAVWRDYYPLNEGDVREYVISGDVCGSPEPCILYVRQEVGGNTMIGGEPYRELSELTYGETFDLIEERTCAVRVLDSGYVEIAEETYCRAVPPGWANLRTYTWTVHRSGLGEEEVVRKTFSYKDWAESGYSASVAIGVGFVERLQRSEGINGGSESETKLLYANIMGTTYGQSVLAPITHSDPAPNPTSALPDGFSIESISPNPFREGATIMLGLAEGTSVSIEVFDMLGRRTLNHVIGDLPAGRSEHQLDASALPPGVYVVRATMASGETSTQRVVKVN